MFSQENCADTKRALTIVLFFLTFLSSPSGLLPQSKSQFKNEIEKTIYSSTRFFVEEINREGIFVWNYLPDFSRMWGEIEAYPSMLWLQGAGSVAMGNVLLDSYKETGDEYYYKNAEIIARAVCKSQLDCGGWNYIFDFTGEESITKWYETIGKNAWRLEEFQHYYGNATFDDEVTTGAAFFLLRFYLFKNDSQVKTHLESAIEFILKSQFQNGSWPQRFPVTDKFNKNVRPDYTSYFTFNDDVTWNNIKFLLACYKIFDNKKFVDPIKRGMNFYLISQMPNPQAGWALQYSHDLKPAGARTYEPKSLDPQFTAKHIEILIKFFEMTGNDKFLERIPDALTWIESVKFPSQNDSIYVLPKFVELDSNKPLFVHRKGSNVKYGNYYVDYENKNLISHYNSIRYVNMKKIKSEIERIEANRKNIIPNDKLIVDGLTGLPNVDKYDRIENYLTLESEKYFDFSKVDPSMIENIISKLDDKGRWLVEGAYITNPYIGNPIDSDHSTDRYSTSRVGDEYDTSAYKDATDQKYISTLTYIINVKLLLSTLKQIKSESR